MEGIGVMLGDDAYADDEGEYAEEWDDPVRKVEEASGDGAEDREEAGEHEAEGGDFSGCMSEV